jgi:PleD family two-component response regulator
MLAAGLSLSMVCVWFTVHTAWLRAGFIVGVLAFLALAIVRQSTSANAAYATSVGTEALLQANQELVAMNKHLHLLATTEHLTGLGNRTILEPARQHIGHPSR